MTPQELHKRTQKTALVTYFCKKFKIIPIPFELNRIDKKIMNPIIRRCKGDIEAWFFEVNYVLALKNRLKVSTAEIVKHVKTADELLTFTCEKIIASKPTDPVMMDQIARIQGLVQEEDPLLSQGVVIPTTKTHDEMVEEFLHPKTHFEFMYQGYNESILPEDFLAGMMQLTGYYSSVHGIAPNSPEMLALLTDFPAATAPIVARVGGDFTKCRMELSVLYMLRTQLFVRDEEIVQNAVSGEALTILFYEKILGTDFFKVAMQNTGQSPALAAVVVEGVYAEIKAARMVIGVVTPDSMGSVMVEGSAAESFKDSVSGRTYDEMAEEFLHPGYKVLPFQYLGYEKSLLNKHFLAGMMQLVWSFASARGIKLESSEMLDLVTNFPAATAPIIALADGDFTKCRPELCMILTLRDHLGISDEEIVQNAGSGELLALLTYEKILNSDSFKKALEHAGHDDESAKVFIDGLYGELADAKAIAGVVNAGSRYYAWGESHSELVEEFLKPSPDPVDFYYRTNGTTLLEGAGEFIDNATEVVLHYIDEHSVAPNSPELLKLMVDFPAATAPIVARFTGDFTKCKAELSVVYVLWYRLGALDSEIVEHVDNSERLAMFAYEKIIPIDWYEKVMTEAGRGDLDMKTHRSHVLKTCRELQAALKKPPVSTILH